LPVAVSSSGCDASELDSVSEGAAELDGLGEDANCALAAAANIVAAERIKICRIRDTEQAGDMAVPQYVELYLQLWGGFPVPYSHLDTIPARRLLWTG
jgi:hypothetical protein